MEDLAEEELQVRLVVLLRVSVTSSEGHNLRCQVVTWAKLQITSLGKERREESVQESVRRVPEASGVYRPREVTRMGGCTPSSPPIQLC